MASLLVFLSASILAAIKIIETKTDIYPVSSGRFTEGIVGQPIFINPILSERNGPDSDISRLLFADLKTIVENYSSNSDRRVYNVRIKGGLVWEDNKPLTADDVIFTIKAIQDPDTNSPLYSSWKGVKVERSSELEIKITLPHPYSMFETIMLDLRPVPKHIFASVPFAHMKLSSYNLEPISSGPFKLSKIEKRKDGFITDYLLERNSRFSGNKPWLDKFTFKFFSNEEEMIKSFNFGNINGFALSDVKKISKIRVPKNINYISMPRYYAIFFNPYNNPLLKDTNLKTALNYATDKIKIIKNALNETALAINNPVVFSPDYDPAPDFSIEKALEVLNASNWNLNSERIWELQSGISAKKAEFGLTVFPVPFLIETAKIIKEDWEKIGIKININIPSPGDFESEIVKPRNYELLLFGNMYGNNLDPFSFWHSSQKFDPGLNFSIYENKSSDYIIEQLRTENDDDKRLKELKKLGALIKSDQPAIFLYSPYYVYITSKNLNGFDSKGLNLPADRLSSVSDWYVKTARVFKKTGIIK